MYAIVEIAGQQFKVENGKKIFVHRLESEEGTEVEFDKVLLIDDEGKITIGEPTIKDAVVGARVLDDKVRGDKLIVFKKKRKKGYRVKNGHRQNF
jgi:large subunit ribosomal protein L21